MTQEQSLLQAILEAPEDDRLRLVYSDWLEEDGQAERAEFIRTQVELARLPPDAPARPALLQREKELLDAHRAAWLKALPRVPSGTKLEFQRGFVGRVTFPLADNFAEKAGPLFAATPIQELAIGKLRLEHLPELADSPLLTRLSALLLEGNPLDDQSVTRLIESLHLAKLTRLHLIDSAVGNRAIQALVASPWRAMLRELDLSWHYFGDRGVEVLAAVPWPHLTSLGLASIGMGSRGVQTLANSPRLPALVRLDVSRNALGAAGAALAASTSLEHLTALNLAETGLGDAGAERLAASEQSARLRALDLSGNAIGEQGARALLASPHLEDLEEIILLPNNFGRTARRDLKQRFGSLSRVTRA
jgi:uncharacterized protein (TIGR02996 family)